MEKIIIIGSGARECYILMKLKSSLQQKEFEFITIGTNMNPYMFKQSNFIYVENYSLDIILSLSVFKEDVLMVIIGPEAPIVNGLENNLRDLNIFTLSPSSELSIIESSKIFTRTLIDECETLNTKNPNFSFIKKDENQTVNREFVVDTILKFKRLINNEVVIKKEGLCGGKGVFVEGDHFTITTRDEFIESSVINDITVYLSEENNNVLLEEKLLGREFSLMSLVDQNENLLHFDPIFDYKRLEDGNLGPNTGSMGAVLLDYERQKSILGLRQINEAQNVNQTVIKELNKRVGGKYKGVIYGSYILQPDGTIKVIEFNCRFGDPEGILALANISNDIINLFKSVKTNSLDKEILESKNLNIVGVYSVPEDYGILNPIKPKNNKFDIFFRGYMQKVYESVLDNRIDDTLSTVFGSCNLIGEHLTTDTSRTILVLGGDPMLYKAVNRVYQNIDGIVSRLKYRTDIGSEFISKYESSGISIDNANSSVAKIKLALKMTYNKNVLSNLGDFGGVYNLDGHRLVSSIDGVGTKTDFVDNYFSKADYYSLGQDIVNHNINDILVMGARPLFFLDYYGTSMLDQKQFVSFVSGASYALGGIDADCEKIPLIGGETAEMPSVYNVNKNDIVGCIIGKIDEAFVNFPRKIEAGDILVSIDSLGPHTNGFSLINKVNWRQEFSKSNNLIEGMSLDKFLENLKTPHKNYYHTVKYFTSVYGQNSIIKMCHITGGGLHENLDRVIPENLSVSFDQSELDNAYPNWCSVIQKATSMSLEEMYRVYNCGIGFVLIVSPEMIEKIVDDKIFEFRKIGVVV